MTSPNVKTGGSGRVHVEETLFIKSLGVKDFLNHPNHPWGISPPPATPSRTHTRWTQAIYANIYMRTRSASFLRRASFPGSLHKPTVGGVIDARVNSRMAKLNSLHIGHTMLDSRSTPSSSDFSVGRISVLCHGRLSLGLCWGGWWNN